MLITKSSPWWKSASIYQIYPSSFLDTNDDGIGDLPGIISKIPYLHLLGVDAVWLSPIYASPQKDMGYDISDYFSVHPPYGTLGDVERLIADLHKRGMKLVMDLVVNHTSDQHAWFQESRKSKSNEKRDWYIWRKGKEYSVVDTIAGGSKVVREPPNNWRGVFGGSAWTYDSETEEYYLHLFSPEQPDLNWENPAVRDIVHYVMKWWLDKGVDGFRMDVINVISKHPDLPDAPVTAPNEKYQWGTEYYVNGPRLHEFLQEMNEKVLSKYDSVAIGEMPWVTDQNEVLKSVQPRRKELNMIFQFDIVDLDIPAGSPTKFACLKCPLAKLKSIVENWQIFMEKNDGWNALFLENHDQPRSVSRYVECLEPEHRFPAAKLLATFLVCQKGTVFIYQGQEIGMGNVPKSWGIEEFKDIETTRYYDEVKETSHNDPIKLAEAMENIHFRARDNARTPMQWDTSPHAGFTSPAASPWMRVNEDHKIINVSAQVNDKDSIYWYWRRLLKLRKENKDIFIDGIFAMRAPTNDSIFIYERKAETGRKAVVALNFTPKVAMVDLVLEGVIPGPAHSVDVALGNLVVVGDPNARHSADTSKRFLKNGSQLELQAFEAVVFILG